MQPELLLGRPCQSALQEYGQHQPTEHMGGEQHLEPGSLEVAANHLARVAAVMPEEAVRLAPQPRMRRCRHKDNAAGHEHPTRLEECGNWVLKVLDDVKEGNDGRSAGMQR